MLHPDIAQVIYIRKLFCQSDSTVSNNQTSSREEKLNLVHFSRFLLIEQTFKSGGYDQRRQALGRDDFSVRTAAVAAGGLRHRVGPGRAADGGRRPIPRATSPRALTTPFPDEAPRRLGSRFGHRRLEADP